MTVLKPARTSGFVCLNGTYRIGAAAPGDPIGSAIGLAKPRVRVVAEPAHLGRANQ